MKELPHITTSARRRSQCARGRDVTAGTGSSAAADRSFRPSGIEAPPVNIGCEDRIARRKNAQTPAVRQIASYLT
jgi:hypothetical protein